MDADEQMLAEAERQAVAAGITNVAWVHGKGEDISPDMGLFRVASMAASFHWMDRGRVVGLLRHRLLDDGVVAYVRATMQRGVDGTAPLPHPRPPRPQIDALVAEFLGEGRRAGLGYRQLDPEDEHALKDARIFRAAGFTGPTQLEVPGWVVDRDAEEVLLARKRWRHDGRPCELLRTTVACGSIGTSTNPVGPQGADGNERWARCVGERGSNVAIGGR